MNRADLVDAIALDTDLPKNEIEKILLSAFDCIQKAIIRDDDVTLSGFGTFSRTIRKARKGYNPHSGEPINIPDLILPKFTPGKDFKKALNSS